MPGIYFHPAHGSITYTMVSNLLAMITATDMKHLSERWSKMVRHLQDHDIKYGIDLVQLLERRKGPGLAYFDDPLEVAIVFTTIEVLKTRKRERGEFDP